MPTLNWNGKEAVVKHHKDVPFRLLEPMPALHCGGPASDNVNSLAIRKWLVAVVDKEGEALDRHDRWLCLLRS